MTSDRFYNHEAGAEPTCRLAPSPRNPDLAPTARIDGPIASPLLAACGVPSEGSNFPAPGERILHYDLVEELGRGAFARVYLAKQESLANRYVALKITSTPTDEPQKLARLQHPN